MGRLQSIALAGLLTLGGVFAPGSLLSQARADEISFVRPAAELATIDALNTEWAQLVRNFESQFRKNDVRTATRVYDFEARLIEHIRRLGSTQLSNGEIYDTQMDSARSLLSRVFDIQEVMWTRAIAKIQRINPGEPEEQIITGVIDRYGPLDRKFNRPGGPNSQVAYEEAKAKGGTIEKFGDDFVQGLQSDELAEWVIRDNGEAVASTDGAKHLFLGKGKKARSAGGLLTVKNSNNDILLAIIMPSSGSYKPGIHSIEPIRQELLEIGLPADRIMVTTSRPGAPALINLMHRANGKSGEAADELSDRLEARIGERVKAPALLNPRIKKVRKSQGLKKPVYAQSKPRWWRPGPKPHK